jgi:hypothetical protein
MTGQGANTNARVDNVVAELKTRIPAADYAALEARRQALLNDPDADEDDVISILRQEFGPPRE